MTLPAPDRPLRVLTFTSLYPNEAQPNHGVFVENRLRHLLQTGRVEASVVAPIPWFPIKHRSFGRYAAFAAAPRSETRHGIFVAHPRYLVIPRLGMNLSPLLMYAGVRAAVTQRCREMGGVDLIDAHYFFPDGVVAALLARDLRLPLTITARGTDINLIPAYPAARRMILWAAGRADALITVCDALKDELVRLGEPANKIRTLRNGVDLDLFKPLPRAETRRIWSLSAPLLLSVGALIPRKRHDLVIRSLPLMPGTSLAIAGEGPQRAVLQQLACDLGVGDRVRFLGPVPHEQLPEVYSAADALVLASTREGWANVLLEAMACGTPAIATNVWGAPEVIRAPQAGRLLDQASPEALAAAVGALLADPPPRSETRRYAESFGWGATSRGQLEVFYGILSARERGRLVTASEAV